MRKHLSCEFAGKHANLAWISFQPDGAISFGLHDKTYISPRFEEKIYVWSAYNRKRAQYLVPSTKAGLRSVKNPHFTYHPDKSMFHLKANKDKPIFEGLTDLPFVLQQQSILPWIRAISRPLHSVLGRVGNRLRQDSINVENWSFAVSSDQVSIGMSLDFVSAELLPILTAKDKTSPDCLSRYVEWHGVVLYVTAEPLKPQIPTLSWFHEH
jgi:hypothetical protein